MKGIILAGGSGTRLYPITKGIVKQLLPIYNKPMIYYPLSVLMLANIKEILIISTPKDIDRFKDIFGDGSGLGLDIQYAIQNHPNGLAEAFIIGEKFIGNDDVCLVLGDNLIYGEGLIKLLENSKQKVENDKKGVVFGYYVDDASAYGVVEFDKNKKAISIEEKPKKPKSNYAVIGLYFYPNDVVQIAKNVKPSDRGELEITTINQEYLSQEKLYVEVLGRGYAWLDTGTHESLLEASNFIEVIEKRQGLKIACIEEIAYKKGYISKERLIALGNELSKNSYGKYLLKVANT
ncbi:glucose-1-phosphate thymidylyltransferase [Campylobacter concisus]|uniref:glucose-1-phosphate thymidylyltransferase RfbA n=1 Tax=Campylobacter concisus TaxID=199 RepID=UPI000B3D5F1C|nr:glucose-1-phosphate thymidylyltransferase RfbA [Campylobacter concisus]OUT10477.1 glucose-1-phosphate thymidylyltransferase [Campylobacter concisus]